MGVKSETCKTGLEVRTELAKTFSRFGEQNHSPEKWMSILSEEFLEAQRELNDYLFKQNEGSDTAYESLNSDGKEAFDRACLKLLREELIQIAAVAINMAESLDRNELKDVQ